MKKYSKTLLNKITNEYTHSQMSPVLNTDLHIDQDLQNLLGVHKTLGHSYYPEIFCHQLDHIDQGNYPYLFIKDGLVELYRYLFTHSNKDISSKLIISKEMSQYLPSEFSQHFYYYGFEDKEPHEENDSLLILDFYEGLDHYVDLKEKLARFKNTKNLKICINYAEKFNKFAHNTLNELINALNEVLSEFVVTNLDELERQNDFSKTRLYFSINPLFTSKSILESTYADKNILFENLETNDEAEVEFQYSYNTNLKIYKLNDKQGISLPEQFTSDFMSLINSDNQFNAYYFVQRILKP